MRHIKYIKNKFSDYDMHVTDYGVLIHADNLDIIKRLPDNYCELLFTDPPYGIGEDGAKNHSRGNRLGFKGKDGKRTGKSIPSRKYTPKDYDSDIPPDEYFEHALRVSENQIIFGGNYFQSVMIEDKSKYIIAGDKVIYEKKPALGATKCWIIWDKMNGKTDFADCEIAWASFDSAVRKYEFMWNGMLQGNMKKRVDRIHPNQKPVELLGYIVRDYANGKKKPILDTHSGSASIALACIEFGMKYIAIEKDKEYFDKSSKRIEYYKHGYSSKIKTNSKELPQKRLELW